MPTPASITIDPSSILSSMRGLVAYAYGLDHSVDVIPPVSTFLRTAERAMRQFLEITQVADPQHPVFQNVRSIALHMTPLLDPQNADKIDQEALAGDSRTPQLRKDIQTAASQILNFLRLGSNPQTASLLRSTDLNLNLDSTRLTPLPWTVLALPAGALEVDQPGPSNPLIMTQVEWIVGRLLRVMATRLDRPNTFQTSLGSYSKRVLSLSPKYFEAVRHLVCGGDYVFPEIQELLALGLAQCWEGLISSPTRNIEDVRSWLRILGHTIADGGARDCFGLRAPIYEAAYILFAVAESRVSERT